jgi:Gpi16 subunit, GPI transamidase component
MVARVIIIVTQTGPWIHYSISEWRSCVHLLQARPLNFHCTKKPRHSVCRGLHPVSTTRLNSAAKVSASNPDMPLSIGVTWDDQSVNNISAMVSKLRTHRFLGGVGDAGGSINVNFINDNEHEVSVVYFETAPWILKYCIAV